MIAWCLTRMCPQRIRSYVIFLNITFEGVVAGMPPTHVAAPPNAVLKQSIQ